MHKPTLLNILKELKNFAPEDPVKSRAVIDYVISASVARDSSLDPKKLLAGAGIKT